MAFPIFSQLQGSCSNHRSLSVSKFGRGPDLTPHRNALNRNCNQPQPLFKRLSKAPAVGDLGKRFPVLFTLTNGLRRVSERYDRKYVQSVGYAKERLYVIQSHESYPIRTDAF